MKIINNVAEMREWSLQQKISGFKVGFVPTMGYLHQGHLSLVELSKQHSHKTVVSIFVNPTQFGPNEDYDSYPRDEKQDLEKCRTNGVDVVFLPSVKEMYPDDFLTFVEVNELGDYLCGSSRPGHFRGVTTIVTMLFNAILPDIAVFGQKDAQQLRIIERMTRELHFGTRIIQGPIFRESDGLAMSSRNVRLSQDHRLQAPGLYKALQRSKTLFEAGERDSSVILNQLKADIKSLCPSGKIDYLEIVNWDKLVPVKTITESSLLALAVFFDKVRLIDNIILEKKS